MLADNRSIPTASGRSDAGLAAGPEIAAEVEVGRAARWIAAGFFCGSLAGVLAPVAPDSRDAENLGREVFVSAATRRFPSGREIAAAGAGRPEDCKSPGFVPSSVMEGISLPLISAPPPATACFSEFNPDGMTTWSAMLKVNSESGDFRISASAPVSRKALADDLAPAAGELTETHCEDLADGAAVLCSNIAWRKGDSNGGEALNP